MADTQLSADIVERLEGQIQDRGNAYWEELYRQRKDAAAEIRRLRDVAQAVGVPDLKTIHDVIAGHLERNGLTHSCVRQAAADIQKLYASQPSPAATVETEEDDETIARRLARIFHGDEVEWRGFLTKAHHWMSLSIDAADKRAQAHPSLSAGNAREVLQEFVTAYGSQESSTSGLDAAFKKAKAVLAAVPQTPLIKGAVYDLGRFGPAEYVGIDVYHGETTHQFRTGDHRPRYIRPDELASLLSRPQCPSESAPDASIPDQRPRE